MRRRAGRTAALLGVALLAGCGTGDVPMRQPQTGATALCRESLHGLDPWSQNDACVAGYEAQGWIREQP